MFFIFSTIVYVSDQPLHSFQLLECGKSARVSYNSRVSNARPSTVCGHESATAYAPQTDLGLNFALPLGSLGRRQK